MKKFMVGALIAASAIASTPAAAGVDVTGPVTNQVATTSGAGGGTWTIEFDGFGGDPTQVVNGLKSSITFEFVSGGGTNQYVFNYTINNLSEAPITGSRVSGFGFDTNPNVQGATSTGVFTNTALNGNYPVGYGNVEVCFNGANSCAGGGGGGVSMGQMSGNTGTLTLTFADARDSIQLLNFVDRYQSIAGAGAITSAIGRQTTHAPEPGTWAMMLIGFGAIGFGLRRRSQPKLLQLA